MQDELKPCAECKERQDRIAQLEVEVARLRELCEYAVDNLEAAEFFQAAAHIACQALQESDYE